MNPTEFRKAETQRRSQAKRANKRAAKRAKRDALPREDRDDLIQEEFFRLKKLPLWRREFKRRRGWAPLFLQIQRSRSSVRYQGLSGVSGRAWSNGKTHLRIGPNADWAAIATMLVHELAHHANQRGEHHGERFCSVLVEAMWQAYEVKLDELPDNRGGWNNYSYALTRTLEAQLRKQLPASERAEYNAQKKAKRKKAVGR